MFLWGLIVGITTFSSEASVFTLLDKYGEEYGGNGIGLLLYRGGLVCDDGFTDTAANAICRYMNYIRANRWTSSFADSDIDDYFSRLRLNYQIKLDEVRCETPDWESCTYKYNFHNCDQTEGVFLSCQGKRSELFTLVDRYGNELDELEDLGLLLYRGGTVCDDHFNDTAADAICKEMNYGSAISWTTYEDVGYFQTRCAITLDDVRCPSTRWESCTFTEWDNCQHSEDVFLSCRKTETDCFTDYKSDTGWFPDSAIIEQRTFVSESACVGRCKQLPNCKAAVISPSFNDRECFLVSTGEVTRRSYWSTASRGGPCPDPNLHFKLVDENGEATTNYGLLLYKDGKVCDSYNTFDTIEAITICSEMGYINSEKNVSWKIGEEWRELQRSYDVSMADPVCRFTTWSSCTFSTSSGRCRNSDDIFLTCNHDDLFSIVDEYGKKGASSGLLLYKGGTVCPERFYDDAAIAICYLLGYERKEEMSYWRAMDKYGIYERTLEYLYCSSDLWSTCTVSTTRTCYAIDDVYLQCKQDNKKLAAGYIVLIVIVVLLVVVGGVFFVIKRRQKFTSQQPTSQQNQTGQTNIAAAGDSNILPPSVNPIAANWETSTENIYETRLDEPVPALGTDNPPPPQYEEPAVQLGDDQIPSYEEVMANDHIYQAPK